MDIFENTNPTARISKQTEIWDLDKSHHPFVQVEAIYEEPIGIKSVTIYGFDGNSIDISGDDIRNESYKEKHPWVEEILIACNVIN